MKSIINLDMSVLSAFLKSYRASFVCILFLSCAVIGKALILDNCMAFGPNDDLYHTFTGLHMAKNLLRNGSMPFFNYYNNFGTPLMGDALTYPFALQAIPYYLTDISDYPLVATINKFVLCAMTLSALLAYYRTLNISIFSSLLVSICVFFNFGHFWHFAHHHYQATLLFTLSILVVQNISIARNNPGLLFWAVTFLFTLMITVSAQI